jgi:hypothetical protein
MVSSFDRRLEIAATILLALSAIGTSWAGYQASLWNGNETEYTNAAMTMRTRATRATTGGSLMRIVDASLFTSWLEAHAHHDTLFAIALRRRFRREFRPAFEAWRETNPDKSANAPLTPFAMPEYQIAAFDSAARLDQDADSLLSVALRANRQSDRLVLYAVMFATAMVFGGIAQQQQSTRSIRLILFGIAILMCGAAMAQLVTTPLG